MDLAPLRARLPGSPLESLLPLVSEDFLSSIRHGDFRRWRSLLAELPPLRATDVDLQTQVRIGVASECTDAERADLETRLRQFSPWRKGPFDLFGIRIDSEWRSELKWQRLEGHIRPLSGRRVLDIGSGNGYFSLRMAGQDAELVLGIDQHIPYVAQFWALKHFLPGQPVFVLPLSLEQLPGQLEYFDTVFSMGVIYHSRAPIEHLLNLHGSMAPGAELVLETLYVEGEEGYSLTPPDRYGRMNNVWFIPSIPTLERWLARSGFGNVRVVDLSRTDSSEQRKTDWMPYDSLDDSLDPANPELTIEGLPAPRRVLIICERQ